MAIPFGLGLLCAFALGGAWATGVPGAALLQWQEPVVIATGRGERGPWQQNESRYDFVDDPAVLVDEQGDTLVAWVDQGKKDVFFRRVAGQGGAASPALNLSRSPATFSWLPRMAGVPGDSRKVLVAWQEIIFSGGSHGGDILFAASHDGGRSFSVPINISNSVGGDGKGRISRDVWHNGSFDIVAAPGGLVLLTWTEYDGALWLSRSTDGGRIFSKPQLVARASSDPARAPALALAPGGEVFLAWTVGENVKADIHLAKSTDSGASFGPARVIAPSAGYSDAPKIAVDSKGAVHLAYAESSGGPWDRYRIRYARSSDSGQTFNAPADISARMPATFASAGFPSLAIDAAGLVYVGWELHPQDRGASRGLGLTVSHDGGRSFAPPIVVPDSIDAQGGFNGSSQGLLMKKLAVGPGGRVAVVNSSLKPGSHSRVWLMRASTAPSAPGKR